MDKPSFDQVKKGYDPDQVERVVHNLHRDLVLTKNQVSDLRNELASSQKRIESLEQELEQSGKPTYAGLGAQFELILRTGEEKAQVLISDASDQANSIMLNARSEAERIQEMQRRVTQEKLDQTETKISFMLNEAEFSAQEILKQATVKSEQIVNEALEEATAVRGTAATEAAQLRSSVKRETEKMLAHAQLEVDEMRTVMLKELQSQTESGAVSEDQTLRQDLEMELSARRFEAEKEYLQKHQEAVESTQKYLDEANSLLAEVMRRLNDKRLEADVLEAHIASQQKADTERSAAEAETILSEAHTRAEEILRDARKQAHELIQDSQIGLKHLREEEHAVRLYFENLHNLIRRVHAREEDTNHIDE